VFIYLARLLENVGCFGRGDPAATGTRREGEVLLVLLGGGCLLGPDLRGTVGLGLNLGRCGGHELETNVNL